MLIGLSAAAVGGAFATAGAFTSSVSASADMRVVVVSELRITPARPDEAYVETDGDGEVEAVVIDELNQRADSQFAGLARITNNGDVSIDRLEFTFEVTDESSGESLDSVSETLRILSDREVSVGDDVYTLLADEDSRLDPGDDVTFGIAVNLLPESAPGSRSDLPEDPFSTTLEIDAIRE